MELTFLPLIKSEAPVTCSLCFANSGWALDTTDLSFSFCSQFEVVGLFLLLSPPPPKKFMLLMQHVCNIIYLIVNLYTLGFFFKGEDLFPDVALLV